MMQVFHPESRCRFAMAREDITPPVGIYHRMWGAARHDRSEGVHRPLTASAVFFGSLHSEATSTADAQLLIALDHCLLGPAEVEGLIQAAANATGVSPSAIVVVFSHTHAAGLLNLDRSELPGGELIPEYLRGLEPTVAQISARAASQAVEATLTYAVGSCRLAAHRDFFDEDLQQWVCGYNPAGDADDALLVARATDVQGNLLATCVNYACHPTTLAWDNRLISPDFPGALREVVEQVSGAPCVFLQGASGDLGPVEGFVGDTEVADRNGRQVGYAALAALESLRSPATVYQYAGAKVSGTSIGCWRSVPIDSQRLQDISRWSVNRSELPLPYRHDQPTIDEARAERARLEREEQAAKQRGDEALAGDLRALAERQTRMVARLRAVPPGKDFPYSATAWRMGDAIWVTAQGEPYQVLQQELRRRFPDHPIVLCTLANGWGPSYIPPRELYGKGIYQESIAFLAPGSLEMLIDELSLRVQRLLD